MKIKFLLEGFFEDFDKNLETFVLPKIDKFISVTSLIEEVFGSESAPLLSQEEEKKLWSVVEQALKNHDIVLEYAKEIAEWKQSIKREGNGFERLHATLRSLEGFLNQADSYNRAVLRKLVQKGFVSQQDVDQILHGKKKQDETDSE